MARRSKGSSVKLETTATAGGASWKRQLTRLLALLLLCAACLQLVFLTRVLMMRVIDPQSTSFQRSEAWRLLVEKHRVAWSQQWLDRAELGTQLPRAVIASEDDGFATHSGLDWDSIEQAWQRNRQRTERSERAAAKGKPTSVKIVGGSTISQQLAKNLFLSGERTLARKGQEMVITLMLETLLPKDRILEIYLNSVEWGEGLFGAGAAAQHYFRLPPSRLSAMQAARLAVMLPAPKRFEKNPASPYVLQRAEVIAQRMSSAALP